MRDAHDPGVWASPHPPSVMCNCAACSAYFKAENERAAGVTPTGGTDGR